MAPGDWMVSVQVADPSLDLALLDPESGKSIVAPWAGNLVELGLTLARFRGADRRQMIVAVTVPVRDYAAVLVAAGWLLGCDAPASPPWRQELQGIERGEPVRLVLPDRVIVDRFYGCQATAAGDLLHVGASRWPVERVITVDVAGDIVEREFGRLMTPRPGGLVAACLNPRLWSRVFGAASVSVVLIGTKSRLDLDLELHATQRGAGRSFDCLGDILRPRSGRRPAWGSLIIAGGAEDLAEPPVEAALAVLDGSTAIRWVPEVSAPVVVALIDRSNADETAAAALLQLRSTGEQVPPAVLGWAPRVGVESLVFVVPR